MQGGGERLALKAHRDCVRSVCVAVLSVAFSAYALQGGPKQPEYADFVSQNTPDMVDPLTGDFNYVIPLGEVPGPNGGFPLTLSYRAGISPAAEASWVGLGWTLNPGSINRSVMGLPDDMMGEGVLSFLYAYSKNEDWSVSLGVGAGPASVGISHYGSGAYGINTSLGVEDIMKFSLGAHNGVFGVSAGVQTPWPVTRASLGVSAYQGQRASYNMGVEVGHSQMSLSFDVSGSVGVSGAVNASMMNTTNASGRTSSKTSMSSTGLYAPLPNGMRISMSFSEYLQEWWQRQAIETFNYGYLYQGGPPVAPGIGAAEADSSGGELPIYGGKGTIPWGWDRKGATLEYSGRPLGFVSPANDVYAMRAEGLQGSFRPRAMMDHRLNIVVANRDSLDINPSEASEALIHGASSLFDTNSAEWAYGYCVSANGSYVYGNDTANADCATAGNAKSNFANDANRLVYHPRGSDGGRFRSHMDFLVSGAGSFMSFDSAEWDESRKKDPAYLPPEQIQTNVDNWAYGLRGATAVEPILSDSGRGGSLEGFRVKRPDGSVYIFAQPVRVLLEGNYNTSDSIGGPIFVDQKAQTKGFFDATVDALTDLGGDVLRYGTFAAYKWAWETGQLVADAVGDFFTGSETINNICKANDSLSANMTQMNWSYMMKTSPYATTWLLTEVRGSDFFNPNSENPNPSVDSTYGFHVKLKYSAPEHYWWRFPFTPPGTPYDSLPNWKIPKAGLTPEECGGEQYTSSFGLKEQFYLAEIETKTHRAVFNLNDSKVSERLDGKGWNPDFGEHLGDSATSRAIKGLTEFPVYVSAVLKATLAGDSATVSYHSATQTVEARSKKYNVEGMYLRTSLPPDRLAAMTENSWAKIAVTNLTKVGECPAKPWTLHTMQSDALPCAGKGLLSSNSSLAFFDMDSIRVVSATERKYGAVYVKFRLDTANTGTFWRSVQKQEANDPGAFPETLMLGDPDQTPDYVPLVNWKPFVETWSEHPNQMRYLKGIDFFDKRTGVP